MATYDTSEMESFDYTGDSVPLRPAVCVGQVFQHEKLPDGHYNILLQGICRARIVAEDAQEDGRMYPSTLTRPAVVFVTSGKVLNNAV